MTIAGVVIGAVAVRTREIYLLMITLAIAVSFYFFVQANVEFLNGYEGIRNVMGPDILGVPLRTPAIFFYAVLAVSA
ncbi:MAG: amino acid/amide transporter rane protein 2, family, partial [Nitrobacter vulgaris]|nr:amino acid/amide transporter rane protein 2, family [Nitrobacter vulgaris]